MPPRDWNSDGSSHSNLGAVHYIFTRHLDSYFSSLYCRYKRLLKKPQLTVSLGGLYVNVFHYAHLGKLTGLGSIVSAIFCLLNDPLFKIVNNILDQDPFWVS